MSKPEFNPNKPFQTVEESNKPEFDPNKPFEEAHDNIITAPTEEPSTLESLARGVAKSATLGFADEATAGLEHLFTGKPYEQALQESRKAYEEAEQANPVASTFGELGGYVVPGMGAAKVLKALTAGRKLGALGTAVNRGLQGKGGIGNFIKAGMAEGALTSPIQSIGTSEKEEIDTKDIAEDTAIGMLAGGAGGVLGKTLQKVGHVIADTPVYKNYKYAQELGHQNKYLGSSKEGMDHVKALGEDAQDALNKHTDLIDTMFNIRDENLNKSPINMNDILTGTEDYLPKRVSREMPEDLSILQNDIERTNATRENLLAKRQEMNNPTPIDDLFPDRPAPGIADDEIELLSGLSRDKTVNDALNLARSIGEMEAALNANFPGLNTIQVKKQMLRAKNTFTMKMAALSQKVPNVDPISVLQKVNKFKKLEAIETEIAQLNKLIPEQQMLLKQRMAGFEPTVLDNSTIVNMPQKSQSIIKNLSDQLDAYREKDINGRDVSDLLQQIKKDIQTMRNSNDLEQKPAIEVFSKFQTHLEDKLKQLDPNFYGENSAGKSAYDALKLLTKLSSNSELNPDEKVKALVNVGKFVKDGDITNVPVDKLIQKNQTDKEMAVAYSKVENYAKNLKSEGEKIGDVTKIEQADKILNAVKDAKLSIENVSKTAKTTEAYSHVLGDKGIAPYTGINQLNWIAKQSLRLGNISGNVPTVTAVVNRGIKGILTANPFEFTQLVKETPFLANKIKSSPTLNKIFVEMADPDTAPARRQAIHNIMINNPIVRKWIEESDEQK